MKPTALLFTFFMVIVLSCTSEDKPMKSPTLQDFQLNLKEEMSYHELIEKFGKPAKDIGSGIHIYVYAMPDATEVWIGFTDKIKCARQVDEQGTLILTII